jgi:hypothetical protein
MQVSSLIGPSSPARRAAGTQPQGCNAPRNNGAELIKPIEIAM